MTELGDDRFLLIDGRRWRRSDPSIPPKLRAELVDELMDARRGVAAARRAADADAEERARSRVQAAKVALGERGEPWWEEPTAEGLRRRIEAAVDALLAHRPRGSVCPSEIARVVGGASWRKTMPAVRELATQAALDGSLEIRQRNAPIAREALAELRGPIRIARPTNASDA